jgi:short-subunit dehydrogenase
MSAFGNLEESNPSVIKEVISSNLVGSLLITHFAIPHIKKEKGNIQFISSLTAIHGIGGYSLYSAAKMAYTGVAQSLRIELNEFNVHVGVMYLSFTENDSAKMTLSPEGKLETVPKRSGFKISTQEESAQLVLNQIAKRKESVVHSSLGKLNAVINRIFPGLVQTILLRNYKKK